MAIEKGERFANEDIFIDYPYEEVTYRWDHPSKQVFVRFYGDEESIQPVPHDNRLFNEALRFGEEITRQDYNRGRSRR
ncbi:hypothetical protein D3C87_884500 [compost metagenome]|jgi:hypothetical protein|uniref:Uncharacterized protein n=1 Tax=Pseudomonas fluorescens TaxID=294 RepID=A0A5E6QJ92_PSEFL|nr:hypothetical protein [Pseudomonas fluorescens]VVM55388.1 hypothetical protein PS659_01033 [Pseudomonas fluorescens]